MLILDRIFIPISELAHPDIGVPDIEPNIKPEIGDVIPDIGVLSPNIRVS